MHVSGTVSRDKNIFFTVAGRASIKFLSSPIRYSSYTINNFFSMLVDNRLTNPAHNGTVLGAGMTRYVYAWTTQIAKSFRFKNYEILYETPLLNTVLTVAPQLAAVPLLFFMRFRTL